MKDSKSSIVQVPLKSGEELKIRKVKQSEKKPDFRMIGRNLIKECSMEAVEILVDFTPQEARVFKELFSSIDYITNICIASNYSKTNTQKVQFSVGYKRLNEKNVVKRMSKGIVSKYMINPDIIIPKDYEYAKKKWDEI